MKQQSLFDEPVLSDVGASLVFGSLMKADGVISIKGEYSIYAELDDECFSLVFKVRKGELKCVKDDEFRSLKSRLIKQVEAARADEIIDSSADMAREMMQFDLDSLVGKVDIPGYEQPCTQSYYSYLKKSGKGHE